MPPGIYKHKKHSEETKKKISENNAKYWLGKKRNINSKPPIRTGISPSKEAIEKQRAKMLGRKKSESTKINMSNAKKGIIPKCSGWNKGLYGYNSGAKHPRWKGITPLNKLIRGRAKWNIWRNQVFLRDNFTCQNKGCKYCKNKIGVKLHPHHRKPLALFPELAYDVDNGITYCEEFHTKSGLHRNMEERFMKNLSEVNLI
jgi:hypothetical protein